MSRCVIRLVINLDVEGSVLPDALFAAHRAAEDAAGAVLLDSGATKALTLPGIMTKITVLRAKRAKRAR